MTFKLGIPEGWEEITEPCTRDLCLQGHLGRVEKGLVAQSELLLGCIPELSGILKNTYQCLPSVRKAFRQGFNI